MLQAKAYPLDALHHPGIHVQNAHTKYYMKTSTIQKFPAIQYGIKH